MKWKTGTTTTTVLAVFLACAVLGQQPNRGTTEIRANGKTISIDYGRPSLNDRDVLSMVQPGEVWRLGMNKATEITANGDLVVDGKVLKAGKYSLWAKKISDQKWVLEFHPKTGVWGYPSLKEGFVAGLPLKLDKTADSLDQLTISLASEESKAQIKIRWGVVVLSGEIGICPVYPIC